MRGFQKKRFCLAIFSLAFLYLFSSCGGPEQIHGMYNMPFPKTAVCSSSDDQSIGFHNDTSEEIVILGVSKSFGTDAGGNFSFRSMVIADREVPTISGGLVNVRIPAGADYSFKFRYSPQSVDKNHETLHEALIDIAYKTPKEGVVQLALSGSAPSSTVTSCVRPNTIQEVGFDGPMVIRVENVIAATSAIASPINTDQGQQPFGSSIDIPIILDRAGHRITLPAFTGDTFVLPPPLASVPGIGGLIHGSLNVRIPEQKVGDYNPSTGAITLSNVKVTMSSTRDFSAELNLTLTTGRLRKNSISRPPGDALNNFGDPIHFDRSTNEIFGTPIAPDGKVFLVGLSDLTSLSYSDDIDPTLEAGLRLGTGMAILLRGTLRTRN